jgi:hypothetical protein
MKVGDLVIVKPSYRLHAPDELAFYIIIDALEDADGFYYYQVQSNKNAGWRKDYELELFSKSG